MGDAGGASRSPGAFLAFVGADLGTIHPLGIPASPASPTPLPSPPEDEWTVVAKKSRRKMNAAGTRAPPEPARDHARSPPSPLPRSERLTRRRRFFFSPSPLPPPAFANLQRVASASAGPLEDPPEATPEKTASMIARAVAELDAEPFVEALLGALDDAGIGVAASSSSSEPGAPNSSPTFARPARSMVVLGLGSPTHSATSRVQLALALKIAAHLGMLTEEGGVAGRSSGARSGVDLYDPAFSPCDVASLNALHPGHVRVASETFADAVCGPDATERRAPTFFFMPHCEADLYDAVIRANWAEVREDEAASEDGAGAGERAAKSNPRAKPTVMAISRHVFLANAFETYAARWAGRERAKERPRHVLRAARAMEAGGGRGRVCVDVDPGGAFGAIGAFNDTRVQALPADLEGWAETDEDEEADG